MRIAIVAAAMLAMTGCANLTDTQRHVIYATGAILVVGAIAAHQLDNGGEAMPTAKHAGGPSCQAQKGC